RTRWSASRHAARSARGWGSTTRRATRACCSGSTAWGAARTARTTASTSACSGGRSRFILGHVHGPWRGSRGLRMTVVARSTADGRFPREELLVQIRDHLHHLARCLLRLFVVARVIAHHVAVVALHAQRGCDVLHDELPLVLGNILQHLDVAKL